MYNIELEVLYMATEEELAWAAGLFEGEGTITRLNKVGASKRWSIAVGMTDYSVIQKLFEVVGVGHVHGPYTYKNSKNRKREFHSPYWVWNVAYRDGIIEVYGQFAKWLSVRRLVKFDEALNDIVFIKGRGRRNQFTAPRPWTPEQDLIVITHSWQESMRVLQRTKGSVLGRRGVLLRRGIRN